MELDPDRFSKGAREQYNAAYRRWGAISFVALGWLIPCLVAYKLGARTAALIILIIGVAIQFLLVVKVSIEIWMSIRRLRAEEVQRRAHRQT